MTLGFIGVFSTKRQQGNLEQLVENASLVEGYKNLSHDALRLRPLLQRTMPQAAKLPEVYDIQV